MVHRNGHIKMDCNQQREGKATIHSNNQFCNNYYKPVPINRMLKTTTGCATSFERKTRRAICRIDYALYCNLMLQFNVTPLFLYFEISSVDSYGYWQMSMQYFIEILSGNSVKLFTWSKK